MMHLRSFSTFLDEFGRNIRIRFVASLRAQRRSVAGRLAELLGSIGSSDEFGISFELRL